MNLGKRQRNENSKKQANDLDLVKFSKVISTATELVQVGIRFQQQEHHEFFLSTACFKKEKSKFAVNNTTLQLPHPVNLEGLVELLDFKNVTFLDLYCQTLAFLVRSSRKIELFQLAPGDLKKVLRVETVTSDLGSLTYNSYELIDGPAIVASDFSANQRRFSLFLRDTSQCQWIVHNIALEMGPEPGFDLTLSDILWNHRIRKDECRYWLSVLSLGGLSTLLTIYEDSNVIEIFILKLKDADGACHFERCEPWSRISEFTKSVNFRAFALTKSNINSDIYIGTSDKIILLSPQMASYCDIAVDTPVNELQIAQVDDMCGVLVASCADNKDRHVKIFSCSGMNHTLILQFNSTDSVFMGNFLNSGKDEICIVPLHCCRDNHNLHTIAKNLILTDCIKIWKNGTKSIISDEIFDLRVEHHDSGLEMSNLEKKNLKKLKKLDKKQEESTKHRAKKLFDVASSLKNTETKNMQQLEIIRNYCSIENGLLNSGHKFLKRLSLLPTHHFDASQQNDICDEFKKGLVPLFKSADDNKMSTLGKNNSSNIDIDAVTDYRIESIDYKYDAISRALTVRVQFKSLFEKRMYNVGVGITSNGGTISTVSDVCVILCPNSTKELFSSSQIPVALLSRQAICLNVFIHYNQSMTSERVIHHIGTLKIPPQEILGLSSTLKSMDIGTRKNCTQEILRYPSILHVTSYCYAFRIILRSKQRNLIDLKGRIEELKGQGFATNVRVDVEFCSRSLASIKFRLAHIELLIPLFQVLKDIIPKDVSLCHDVCNIKMFKLASACIKSLRQETYGENCQNITDLLISMLMTSSGVQHNSE